MRSIISLVVVAGCAVASPTPLSPSSRRNAYDIVTDISSGSSGPLDLAGTGILSEGSGLLGGNGGLGGLHLRHVKRSLFDGLSTSDVGGTLDSPTKGLSDLGLGGGLEKNKALLDYGNPLASETPQGNTCSTGHRYCCKDVRRYTDPRNAALIDGVLTLDDQLNKHLLGLNCHAITGSLVPGSCRENAV